MAALTAAIVLFTTVPPAPRIAELPPGGAGRFVRGAFHIHTTRSDGALGKADVAAAAARAGLQFAVFTDHGDGQRASDPPEYRHGVLCLDGVEISSNDGHYIAVGMTRAPYPLGGDGAAVAEDVARLGGFGIVAHPASTRSELAWSEWDVAMDGIEWLNADSEWREEGRVALARSVLGYLWRPAGALVQLLDRPVEALRRWDRAAPGRKVVALAGHDAHGGFGAETGGRRGRRLHIPSYEASFRTFSLYAILREPFTGDAARDAAALTAALRRGAVFTGVDAVAGPAVVDFRGALHGTTVAMGDTLPDAPGAARFSIRAAAPAGVRTVLKRNGETISERSGGVLDHEDASEGVYRVEIDVRGAPGSPPVPWIVTNPIYRPGPPSRDPDAAASPSVGVAVHNVPDRAWRVEAASGSSGTVATRDGAVSLIYRLKGEPRSSQFVALAADLQQVPPGVSGIALRGRSAQPMRLSVQLRYNAQRDERWGRSIYLDAADREIHVPIKTLRFLDSNAANARARGQAPEPSSATSLLFVIDLTNTNPGAEGEVTLGEVRLTR